MTLRVEGKALRTPKWSRAEGMSMILHRIGYLLLDLFEFIFHPNNQSLDI